MALLKFQMAPRLILLISSGSKKKEPRYTCLSEAKASHLQRTWAEVSSSSWGFYTTIFRVKGSSKPGGLKMEAVGFSEMLVTTYLTTW
jgi:hypothetical protein